MSEHWLLQRIRAWLCSHEFAIEDLSLVAGADHDNRVRWPCSKCGKVFRAHCGLEISPKHGYTFRRAPLPNHTRGESNGY